MYMYMVETITEVSFEGLRYKNTRALFFESNNWVQALPLIALFGIPGGPQNKSKKH